jgi:hypothetical protein
MEKKKKNPTNYKIIIKSNIVNITTFETTPSVRKDKKPATKAT